MTGLRVFIPLFGYYVERSVVPVAMKHLRRRPLPDASMTGGTDQLRSAATHGWLPVE